MIRGRRIGIQGIVRSGPLSSVKILEVVAGIQVTMFFTVCSVSICTSYYAQSQLHSSYDLSTMATFTDDVRILPFAIKKLSCVDSKPFARWILGVAVSNALDMTCSCV